VLQDEPPYINRPLPASFIPSKPPLSSIPELSSSLDPMVGKEIIPFGVDLNKLSPREDSLATVLVEEPLPLAIIPPKQVVIVPQIRSYEQAYYAQVHQLMLPPP
jgi:hypothetical protein